MQKQSFSVGGGSKKFQEWGRIKNFRNGWGFTFGEKGGGSVPHYMAWLFQVSHNCVTICTLQAKFLLKLIHKHIPFFPVCGISKYVIFLYNRRGKVKLLDFQ